MNNNKFRHEIKHYINTADYLAIRSRLVHFMKLDENSGTSEYKIRSLYFDNVNNKALMEKINGINNREKFRIRFYNDNHNFIRLEKKSKLNGLCSKISERLSKDECIKIINNDIEFLKDSKRPLLIEFYNKMKSDMLKPKTVVDYYREAYIYPVGNVRITFDKNVRTSINGINIFDKNLPTINSINKNVIILEVKYDEFLPEIIQHLIQTNESRATAISKYAAARIYG